VLDDLLLAAAWAAHAERAAHEAARLGAFQRSVASAARVDTANGRGARLLESPNELSAAGGEGHGRMIQVK
jgi:hypothetical protein